MHPSFQRQYFQRENQTLDHPLIDMVHIGMVIPTGYGWQTS